MVEGAPDARRLNGLRQIWGEGGAALSRPFLLSKLSRHSLKLGWILS